jgi:amino acid transporter
MAESIQEIFKRKLVPVRFERSMGLLGATTLGIGALMGAGIYVLIGLAAGKAGPAVWLSYLICGLLSLLSVHVFGELSRRIPIAGGGYAFAYKALGSFWGFITGWLLALGSIFACAMYAMGFGYYFGPLMPFPLPETALKGLGLVIVVVLTLLNCRGARGGDRVQRILTWGNLLVLMTLIIFAAHKADAGRLRPLFPHGLTGIGEAIAIIYVSFFGYQLIANTAEEIIDPEKTVPRAMLLSMIVSLAFYVAVAVTAVTVIPWEALARSKAPLVEVAVKGLGSRGWLLIAVGGVLASAAALNSTLLSQARQIFAMGKNGFLPALLGRIHAVNRTPLAALGAGGIVTAAALVFGDLTFIVKSANFCFLTSLLPASFALRKLYRTSREEDLPARWLRYIPETSCLANLLLLFTLDWVSIVFGLQLMGAGILIYFLYSRKREVRSRTGMSLVLSEKQQSLRLGQFRILVPMANPQTQPALFAISESLLARQSGELVVLNVVRATEQVDFYAALSHAEDSVHLLDGSTQLPTSNQVTIRPVIRVSRSLPKGIAHAAEEEHCNLIVMGYPGEEAHASIQLVEDVLNLARTDIILFKLRGQFAPKRIGVSLGASGNLNLIVRLAGALADRYGGHITFMNILPENYTSEQKAHSGKILMEAIKHHGANALFRSEVASSDQPLDFLVARSGEFDLLIVGATKVRFLEKAAVGPFSSQIALRSDCSVAIVRVAPTVKKIMPL